MKSIQPLSESVLRDKTTWAQIGRRILASYGCDATPGGIGKCIDIWRGERRVPEDEMLDGLGFLLGDLAIEQYGGEWCWVKDDFGETPAIQRSQGGYISYALDWVSKRLTDTTVVAEREIPSLVDTFGRQ
jgi:hypothetical protein